MVHPVLVYCYWIFTASKFMCGCWMDRCYKAVIFAQSGAVSVGPYHPQWIKIANVFFFFMIQLWLFV
jgi:hypothetical protein